MDNLSIVLDSLYDLEPDWRLLGENLKISVSALDSIASNCCGRNKECFPGVIVYWLQHDMEDHPLEVLYSTLESHASLKKHLYLVNILACKMLKIKRKPA